ncbi:lysine-arginine-ornithine-binding periplasmic protein [Escherichia coli]|nr:lysine-arginine-ornithine-binding periplasmic protein [Escherichia coli]
MPSRQAVRRRFSFDCGKGSPIQPTLDSLKGKHVGVLQGSTQEAYANETWRSKGVDVVAYANQDLVYSDLAAGRLDAALQDEVAASEGFLKQPAGKDSPLLAHQ